MHRIPSTWGYDGYARLPTFWPSVKIEYNGDGAGQVREGGERAPAAICHYYLLVGDLRYQPDCTHHLAGRTMALPDIPEGA